MAAVLQQARRVLIVTAMGVALLWTGSAMADPVDEAWKLLESGQYEAAQRLFSSAEDTNARAQLGLAVYYQRTGKYEELEKQLDVVEKLEEVSEDGKTLRAEHYVYTGEYKKAAKLFEDLVDANPENTRAMVGLGELYYLLGRKNDGDQVMNLFAPLYNKGKADTAEKLAHVGIAMWRSESFQDANLAFTEANETDSKYLPAYMHAGFLYLDKYNQRDADLMFQKALELDPKRPMAQVGMARVFIDSAHDFESASVHLNEAMAVNPNLVEGLNLSAEMALTDEDTESALEFIERALEINPQNLHSLSLKATAYYLADDTDKQKKAEKKVLKINKRYAQLYVTMAHFGEFAHRYEEGIELYEKALKLDKTHWKAFVGLGIAYTRIGDDNKGYEYLEKAFEADPYNVRAYNMVELYDKTLKKYEFVERGSMRFRFHKDEKDVLELYIPPLMEGANMLYKRKYDFEPSKPLSVEVFRDPTSFAVRSVGLPGAAAQGICFGKVITSQSPSQGNFNWAQTLWHELAHVYHIQLSDSRVPRWFTEGLAEYETVLARPEWRREYDIEVWVALQNGKLRGIDTLNDGFTKAKNMQEIVVAYYQSSLVIEYIDKTWGFDSLVAMLQAWGDRKRTPEVLSEVLGVTVDEFNEGFNKWLKSRLAFLEKSYELDVDGYFVRYDEFMAAAQKSPDSATAQANAGFAELVRHVDFDAAKQRLSKALELDEKNVEANYLGGTIALREGNYEESISYYKKLLELGIDGYTIRIELGFLNKKLGKIDDAITHYDKAKTFYDRGAFPYRHLAEIYMTRGEERKARQELESLIEINQNDFSIANELVAMAMDAGEVDSARRYGEIALDIYPFDKELHLKMGKVGIKQQDWLLAEREFKALIELSPTDPFDGYIGLAEVYVELDQKKLARDYIELAKAVRPNDPTISRIEARMQ